MRHIPNLLTLTRIFLTPVCVYFLLTGKAQIAVPLTIFTGLTDLFDGYLARRLGVETRFGAGLDPVADKVLLTSLYVSFGVVKAVPEWLVWLVVGRDAAILAMVAAGLLLTEIRDFPPTIWGKISTVIQIVGVVILLEAVAGSVVGLQLQSLTIWTVAAATLWSGLHYIWRGVGMLRASR